MLRPEPEAEQTVPVDRDERLGEAIEAYLELAEASGPTDPEEFARAYPDLGEDLVAALEGLALVQGLVGEANGPGRRLEEGRRVAGYRIVRELGRGGMGIVYEAVHVGLDRPVALKVLGTQAAPDSSGRRRFLNEAKTAAGLHHTHIVPVFDVGQVGGLCYYAMQRIEGSGLDRVLRVLRRDRSVAAGSTMGSGSRKGGGSNGLRPPAIVPGPLEDSRALSGLGDETRSWRGVSDIGGGSAWRTREPVDLPPTFTPPRGSAYYRWVADVGRQAADALAHAHQRGVIHRDIKPSNLLVDGRGMVWVADFGLARRLADPSQTHFDSLLGTPRYMSPEQARTGVLDGRADIYSLGATLYELITLRPPFDGRSAAELVDQIKTQEPGRPRKFDPRVPLDLETILLKALAKRPDDRYATADALAEDLARFLAYEPVKARRIGPVGRMVRFARRHPSLTAVSSTAAALVLSTATIAYVRVVDARDRADAAADAAKQAQRDTENARRKLQDAYTELQAANQGNRARTLDVLQLLAANVRHSDVPDRRSKGLDSLAQAAAMKPDPATLVKLRDRAVDFLSMRDVEARATIPTPNRSPQGLAFVADGKRVAALSERGEMGVWDITKRELIHSTDLSIALSRPRPLGGRGGGRGRPGELRVLGDLRVATAGDRLAMITPEGNGVRFFDPAMPDARVDELPMEGHHVVALLSSADGRRLLTVDRATRQGPPDRLEASSEDPRITLWNRDRAEPSEITLTLPPRPLDQPYTLGRPFFLMLAIAPDGSRIAAARQNETEITLWDGAGKLLSPVDVQLNATALALGPAGYLAVAGNGGEIALRDLSPATPKRLPSLGPHQNMIFQLRFSPRDGSILAATGWDGIDLWDVSRNALIAALPAKEVENLAFSPDGRTLAASQASGIATWSVVEPVAQHVLPETGDIPRSVAFGPGDVLAIASTEGNNPPSPLRLWDGPGSCPVSIQAWDKVRPLWVGVDTRGRLMAVELDAVRWFKLPATEPAAEPLLLSPGRFADDRGPRSDRRKGEGPPGSNSPRSDRGKGEGPNGPGFTRLAARTPDGRTLLFARSDAYYLWREDAPDSFSRLSPLEAVQGNAGRGPLMALDPGGVWVYYLSQIGEALNARWIGPNPRPDVWSIPVPQGTILTISPDGRTLAIALRSGDILLVDTARNSISQTLTRVADDPESVDSLGFSPDGLTLAVGSREQIRLWNLAGKPLPIVRLPGNRGIVRSLTFDLKGVRLAGADDKVKVWDLTPLHAELAKLGLDW